MTTKRFSYFKSKIGFGKQGIDDNLKGYTFDFTLDNVLDCMNELAEENQELKRLVKVTVEDYTDLKKSFDLIDKENEKLKQFKEDVFNKIDMHLRMLPTTRDNEFNEDDGDPSLYTGAIYMLETLKKELKE